MRVLHINCNYLYTALYSCLKKKLDNRGIKNTVYMPTYREHENNDKDVIASKCFKKWDRLLFFRKQKKIYCDIEKKIDMSQIELMHAYILFTDGNVAYNLKKKYNIPYITHIQNTDVNTFFKYMPHLRRRGLKIMLESSGIIFFSEVYRDRVLKKYVPRKYRQQILEKAYIIPSGIDDMWLENQSFKQENPSEKDVLKIACVGAINRDKNIMSVVKAAELLNNKGKKCFVDIAGRPENPEVIKEIGKSSCAEYHGCIPKEELIKIYRNNDLFILPSFHESFGLVYAEAMSQGLPIIYTRGEGFDGQFPEGEVGYSVDPSSVDDIISKINLVLDDYNRISSNCSKKSEVFKWDVIAEQYSDIYKKNYIKRM